MEILVIGAGVSGLTTALCLRRAGHEVTIWARELSPRTTSNVAAAVWLPFAVEGADVVGWGRRAYDIFRALYTVEESGVLPISVLELYQTAAGEPAWAGNVAGFRHATPDELPPGYADGYSFEAPVIDMSVYLGYLTRLALAEGITIEQRNVASLDEALAHVGVVVACAGLGARDLAADDKTHSADARGVYPVRGQVIRIEHNGFARAITDESESNELTYIVPRKRDIVLGGTFEPGNESTALDAATREGILRRCAQLAWHYDQRFALSLAALVGGAFHIECQQRANPGLADTAPAVIREEACGLRPVRASVRLEMARLAPERALVHNYGHGGAGVTLSWGCAAEVVRLVGTLQE
jgi:D-amino-acid oxidase